MEREKRLICHQPGEEMERTRRVSLEEPVTLQRTVNQSTMDAQRARAQATQEHGNQPQMPH